uniref:Uncharacterized protein n=1 Tax=Solanum lycopersicum TaxID=4081 RepID=A0A3Q7IKZ4_SOLLC
MAFIQMKIVAATIIYNYHIQLGVDQIIAPSASIIIQMKHGLKVRLEKRLKELILNLNNSLISISKEMDALELFLPLLIIIMCFTWWYLSNRWWRLSSVPTNWPLVGMLPGLFRNAHRVHELQLMFLWKLRELLSFMVLFLPT